MPTLTLSNEEYDRIMRDRQPDAVKATGYCEDYPCCGHTPDDPCTYEWYDNPHRMSEWAQAHAYCDHEAGFYECENRYEDDPDPDTCEHTDVSRYTRPRYGTWYECSYCECYMTPIVAVADETYESTAVPGLSITIPVLTLRFERTDS